MPLEIASESPVETWAVPEGLLGTWTWCGVELLIELGLSMSVPADEGVGAVETLILLKCSGKTSASEVELEAPATVSYRGDCDGKLLRTDHLFE